MSPSNFRFLIEIQGHLPWSQLEHGQGCRRVFHDCRGAQQDGGIGQQSHDPGQSEAVEENPAQAELIFFEGLRWLDPRAYLLEQSLGRASVHGQQSQQGFMCGSRKAKLARTIAGLPTAGAQGRRMSHSEPMVLVGRIISEPLQGLALGTGSLGRGLKRRNQFHVGLESSHDRRAPAFSDVPFGVGVNIAHVSHHDVRTPSPTLMATGDAGLQQAPFARIGRRHPTDQRDQQHTGGMVADPQPQRVFFVPQEKTALAGLECAPAQFRAFGRIAARAFFLKPLAEAGRSVASIKATDRESPDGLGTKDSASVSLMRRKPATPTRSRNSWSMRTPGTFCRCERCANFRHARCSANMSTSRLKEWTGVSTASRCVRHSWAELKEFRRPGPRLGGKCSLMKPSGMCGESDASNWAVPVEGKGDFMPQPTTQKITTGRQDSGNHVFWEEVAHE